MFYFTFDNNKSVKAINIRILTCFPVLGQTKSNIAFNIYLVETVFDEPVLLFDLPFLLVDCS